jgi:AhpD family alkylhydroperoxidase
MRVPPVPNPRSPLVRLAYWMTRRQYGKVPEAFQVIYGNAPSLARASWSIVQTSEKRLSLPEELRLLVATQSSLMNGCSFCADLHQAQAIQMKMGKARFRDLLEFRTSPHYSEAERAALAFTEEITRDRKASDATFEALRSHFDDRQIVELAWLVAIGNFYNLQAVALGLESAGLAEIAARRAA